MTLHPVDLGDVPEAVHLSAFGHLLPLDGRGLQSNWKSRYSFIERREKGRLWINVKAADQWLDERGRPLLSEGIITEKKKRNPSWRPARDRVEGALAGIPEKILTDFLAHLVTQKSTSSTCGEVSNG